MIKKIPLLGVILICFIPSFLAGQGYSYVNYNIKEGLAGSMVYCMVQDHDGFIWFGTETGLSRFDGQRFTNFTTLDGLPDNEIIQLFVDSKNRIWIMPFQNKVCYFYKGKLYTDQNDSMLKKLPYMGGVVSVIENARNEIAIVQADGIHTIAADNSVVPVQMPQQRFKIHMAGLGFDGSLMVNALVYDLLFVQLHHIVDNKLAHYLSYTEFPLINSNGMYLAKDVRIMYRHPDSLVFFTPSGRFSLPAHPDFVNLSRLNDSLIAVINVKQTEIINIKRRTVEDRFLINENISNVLEDQEGNLWFASMGKGIYKLPSRKFKATTLVRNGNYQPVYSIARWDNSLWLGSHNYTLWKLNPATNQTEWQSLSQGFNQGRIITFNVLGKNRVLIGTDGGFYTLEGERITQIPIPTAIKSTYLENDSLFIGHSVGAELLVLPLMKRGAMLFYTRTTAIYKRLDSLFLGTLKGLFIQRGKQMDSVAKTNPALAGRISVIKEASDGTIWIGTYGSGIVGYRNGKFSILLNRDSGLTSNIVRAIFADGKNLWVGTDKGLNKVEPVGGSYKITPFTSADGINSDIINAVYVDSQTVYVGTSMGLSWFREEEVSTRSMCKLRLLSIRSDKQPAITDSANLSFEHYDTDIRFEFTGISFKSAGEITYRYRLQGLDNDWHTTTENFLNYPTLPSGGYVLEVQAINKFGVESDMLRIDFFIEKLLWEKNWFRILAVIFLAGMIWIFMAWRIRSIRRQSEARAETNQKIAELEQMALKAQMNPHFIFNSLNSIQHFMFDKDVAGANRYITDFSRLIRLTLEFSSKTKISIEDEIRFLSTYLELETKRFEGKFTYRIHLDNQIEPSQFHIPPMLLQPYIENSIRHGIRYREDNDGLITVDFSIEDDQLVISLEDNGVGRERSAELKGPNNIEYQSQGMNLTARRVEMFNKSSKFPINIDISDVYDGSIVAGTKVVIRILLPK
jgi:hypothetical protein